MVASACSGGIDGSSPGSAGTGASTETACESGLTRVCIGPGACKGGQKCLPDGSWSDCDCGELGSGGARGSGGSPVNAVGGFPMAQGGGLPITFGGSYPVITVGGFPMAQGGSLPITFGGYPVVSFGGYPTATGGVSVSFGGYPTGSGGAPTGGRSTGGTGAVTGSLNVTAGGYVQGTGYHGYAWTAAGTAGLASTIAPADFSTTVSASRLCVSGSVAPDATFGGFAMLGVNLNQDSAANSPVNAYTPAGTSVTVSVTNTGGSPLRVQIQAPGGDTDATQRWCANLTGSGGSILLSSFNTACSDNSGSYYTAGTALQNIMIMVPGNDATAVSFNFCLNALSI
jgi:hypothetical protein